MKQKEKHKEKKKDQGCNLYIFSYFFEGFKLAQTCD